MISLLLPAVSTRLSFLSIFNSDGTSTGGKKRCVFVSLCKMRFSHLNQRATEDPQWASILTVYELKSQHQAGREKNLSSNSRNELTREEDSAKDRRQVYDDLFLEWAVSNYWSEVEFWFWLELKPNLSAWKMLDMHRARRLWMLWIKMSSTRLILGSVESF